MATAEFPGALPAIYTADPDEPLAVAHPDLHEKLSKEQRATDTKLGTGASTPTSVDDVLYVTGSGASAWGKRGLVKLGEVSGNGSSAALQVSSIPQTCRSLHVEVVGRSSAALALAGVLLTLNGDSTAGDYWSQNLQAHTTGLTAAQFLGSAANMNLGGVSGASSTSLVFGSLQFDIPEYADTTNYKTVMSQACEIGDLNSTNIYLQNTVGLVKITAGVSTIAVTLGSGNWVAGSRMTIWGKV